MNKLRYILAAILVVFVFGVSYLNFKNSKYDFTLQSEKGWVSLKDFKGEKLIVYFGYTSCPDVCPTTLALIAKTLEQIPNATKAKVLFISLDPLRDNDVQKTNEWLRYFYPNSQALIAKDEKELTKIAKNYGVIFQKIDLKDSFLKYSIAHGSDLFLFDENANFVKVIKDLSYENFRTEMQKFLN